MIQEKERNEVIFNKEKGKKNTGEAILSPIVLQENVKAAFEY